MLCDIMVDVLFDGMMSLDVISMMSCDVSMMLCDVMLDVLYMLSLYLQCLKTFFLNPCEMCNSASRPNITWKFQVHFVNSLIFIV